MLKRNFSIRSWKPMRISNQLFFGILSICSLLSTQLANATEVGNGKSYATLKSAFDAINNGTLTGDVLLEITSDITETETALLYGSNYTSVIIRPKGGAWTISGTFSDGNGGSRTSIIQLWGSRNVTIDGRIDGTGSTRSLTIANLSNNYWGNTYAVRFNNDASNNTVKYCTIKARNYSTTNGQAGMIIFHSPSMTGNDNNTIDHCLFDGEENIAKNGWHVDSWGDDNLVISNNEFKNISHNGGWIYNVGNNHTVTGNSIYWTVASTSNSGIMNGINIRNTNGDATIEDNFIGGSEAQCGGVAAPLTINSYFTGIFFQGTAANNKILSIQGNTVANIHISQATGGNSSGYFTGIGINYNTNYNSIFNIGNIKGNTIGSKTSAGSIVVRINNTSTDYESNPYVSGIQFQPSGGQGSIINNHIGGILMPAQTVASKYLTFYGITSNHPGVTIRNNTIGSTTVAKSIENATGNASTLYSINTIGIQALATNNELPTAIAGNTITNMAITSEALYSALKGIDITGSYSTANVRIDSNTVSKLYTSSVSTGMNHSPAVSGIIAANATSVSGNTVYDLYQTATAGAVHAYGIGITGGTPLVSRNYVHHISMASPAGTLKGIFGSNFASAPITITNNQIHLGYHPDGTSLTAGATIHGLSFSQPQVMYNNTIYIGGTSVESNSSTAAVHSAYSLASTRYINNILVNNRSNSTGSARNLIYLFNGNLPTGAQMSNNIYQNNGVGAFFGTAGTVVAPVFSAWRTLNNSDLNSGETDPLFKRIIASSGSVIMRLQQANPAEGRGITTTTVTHDMYGTARDASTPDIGAEEGSFTQTNEDMQPPTITITDLVEMPVGNKVMLTDFATITDDGTIAGGASAPRFYYKLSTNANTFGGNTSGDDGWKYVTATNSTSPYSFEVDFSLLYGNISTGSVIQYFVAAQDEANHLTTYPAIAGASSNPPVQNINFGNAAALQSFTVASVLPIKLSSFTGTTRDGVNNLKWTTAMESGNNYFEIERSADGINFTAIGQVKSAGDATNEQQYSFIDVNPLNGVNYYRLKQVDIDGKTTRFKTISLSNSNLGVTVSPNPAVDFVKVRFESKLANATVSLITLSGQTIYHISAVSGNECRIDLSSTPRGTYILQVKDGVKTFSTKIIKR